MEVRYLPAGDEAIVIEFGKTIDEEINNRVISMATSIRNKRIKGVREILPTYRSLMVFYNPKKISYIKLVSTVKTLKFMENNDEEEAKKTLIVPCCYDGSFGPDLEDMSRELGLTREEIVKIHSGMEYKIYMMGFLPGFVYLGGLDKRINIPRLQTPRTRIPARSVGIGGAQTGVYPVDSPGGWRLIGSTPLDFYDIKRDKPILCEAGEYIKFKPISRSEYDDIRREIESGNYKPEYENKKIVQMFR
jgi:KipI family sensor histidine kinase inhibitor